MVQILYLGVNILFISLQCIVLFFTVYNMSLWMISLFVKKKYKKYLIDHKHKFTLLVCCHNEDVVIGDIIRSIQKVNYPKELYDIYVICDNCNESDRSAEISISLGANVIVRQDKTNVGKGYGIDYVLKHLWSLDDFNSDGIFILDADNLVSDNLLTEANKRFNMKEDVIQFRVDTKNVDDSVFTKADAMAFWNSSVFYQQVRYKLGVSNQLCGTAMLFNSKVLKEFGWNCNSLAEDMEFSCLYPMKTGEIVTYCSDAYVLDEKPLGFKAQFTQKKRWVSAHINLGIKFSPLLLKHSIMKMSLITFDNLIYLIQPLKIFTSTSLLFLSFLEYYTNFINIFPYYVWLILFLFYIFQVNYSLYVFGYIKNWYWIFTSYLVSFMWFPLVVMGFKERNSRSWNPTKHTQTVAVLKEQIKEESIPELQVNII